MSDLTHQEKLDHHKSRLQERGYCRVATLSAADVQEIVGDLGLDPRECFIDAWAWMYVRGANERVDDYVKGLRGER